MSDSEFQLIETAFRRHASCRHEHTVIANGDDASVHQLPPGFELVVSTDTSIKGVHWPHDMPLHQAADRAVCAALSDLAAMGAEACWAWLAVTLEEAGQAALIGEGVASALHRFQVELAGGDTTRGNQCTITVTVAGMLPAGAAMRRDRAGVGDKIWLAGRLGYSRLGLQQWLSGEKDGWFVDDFVRVQPLLTVGQRLREVGVRCCLDVSDGLLQDAGHICRASAVSMQMELSRLPGFSELEGQVDKPALIQALLAGGEDYALLFTAPTELQGLDAWAVEVGVCSESGQGVEVYDQGRRLQLTSQGYDHFA